MGFPFTKSRSKNSTTPGDAPVDNSSNRRKFLSGGLFKRDRSSKSTGGLEQSTPATTESVQPKNLPLIESDDNNAFEVITPEARRARELQQENIRKQLFTSPDGDNLSPEPLGRIATAKSVEVTTDGQYIHATDSFEAHTVTPDSIHSGGPLPKIAEERETKGYVPSDTPSTYGISPSLVNDSSSLLLTSNDTVRAKRAASYRGPVSIDTPDSSFQNASMDSSMYRGPVSVDTPNRFSSAIPEQPGDIEPFDEQQDRKDSPSAGRLPESPSSPPDVFEDSGDPLETSDVQLPLDAAAAAVPPEDALDVSTLGRSIDTDGLEAAREQQNTTPLEKQGDSGTTPEIARQLLGAFQCASDETPGGKQTNTMMETVKQTIQDTANSAVLKRVADLFYDKSAAAAEQVKETPRQFYDDSFTNRFIHRMTTKGAALLYLQAPGTPGNDSLDWKGRTVGMVLEKGSSSQQNGGPVQPRLEWTTCAGGQTFEVSTTSVGLLNILSITGSVQALDDSLEEEGEAEGLCFFTITTHEGEVYVFESNSPAERDSLVHGLKNVISRLALHLVVGDATATSELYYADDEDKDDLADNTSPGNFLNPRQTMNRVTHIMLDA